MKLKQYPIKRIIGLLFLLTAPAILGAFSDDIYSDNTICPSKRWLDITCPGCGLTKSIYALTQGDIVLSLNYNILGLLFVLMAISLLIITIIDLFFNKYYYHKIVDNTTLWQSLTILYIIYFLITQAAEHFA